MKRQASRQKLCLSFVQDEESVEHVTVCSLDKCKPDVCLSRMQIYLTHHLPPEGLIPLGDCTSVMLIRC